MQLRAPDRPRRAGDLAARASAALDVGDLAGAKELFSAAVQADRKNALHRFNLAIVIEALGDSGGAAEQLTTALRLDPAMTAASRRLCWLVARGALPDHTRLDSEGLRAALAHPTGDRDLLAAAILRRMARLEPMRGVIERGRARGWLEAARSQCLNTTGALLRQPLLLDALRRGIVSDPDVEQLLTAARRVLLLELAPSRLSERALASFAAALVQQCWLNEFVWAETPDEMHALDRQQIEIGKALAGQPASSHALLLRSMYRAPEHVLGPTIAASDLRRLQPAELREALAARISEEHGVREHGARVPQLGVLSNDTSRRVADQYEASPYPRWTSLLTFRRGEYLQKLQSVFASRELGFLNRPFDVLIAGCGTGRQAVSAAIEYGANAEVTAIDISVSSLGYASQMAQSFKVSNVSFLRADLRELDALDPSYAGRFQVIECIGVLHHMADPTEGLRTLRRCLAPGGIMLIGLYSATARRSLAALNADPAFPGAACDQAALRRYRQHLVSLAEGAPGSELRRNLDFYSSSGFRDFFLHVSERCYTLPEIAGLLEETDLTFRGFFDMPLQLLKERYPAEVWPGSLAHWAEVEAQRPQLFASMYQFWCTAAQ